MKLIYILILSFISWIILFTTLVSTSLKHKRSEVQVVPTPTPILESTLPLKTDEEKVDEMLDLIHLKVKETNKK